MNEQLATPLTEFFWLVIGISSPVFLVGLAVLTWMLKLDNISWLRVMATLPFWLSTDALLTIAFWFVLGTFGWQFKYDFLMIFAPALIATLITIIPAYWLSKRFMETTIKMDNAKPRSTDET